MQGLAGVILAAGRGARMGKFSLRLPKPILPVCGKPLLQHQIEHMKGLGIRDITVVIGHLGFEIAKCLGDGSQLGVRIRYVEQKETLGIAHALGQLEPYLSGPFLLFLGDIFFVTNDLSSMVDQLRQGAGAVLAVKEEANQEAIKRNFAVILDDRNLVRRVIEKPRYIANNLKGCGLYMFDLPIFDAIRRTPRTALRDEYEITDAIQILIEDGIPVRIAPVVTWDVNLTYPHDLLRCNLEHLRWTGQEAWVAPSARIHPGARIIHSVLDEHVVVENPIRIQDSLVLANTIVSSEAHLAQGILTPDGFVDCRQLNGEVL
jgi:dTDP-glucose pyrophosphorylase